MPFEIDPVCCSVSRHAAYGECNHPGSSRHRCRWVPLNNRDASNRLPTPRHFPPHQTNQIRLAGTGPLLPTFAFYHHKPGKRSGQLICYPPMGNSWCFRSVRRTPTLLPWANGNHDRSVRITIGHMQLHQSMQFHVPANPASLTIDLSVLRGLYLK